MVSGAIKDSVNSGLYKMENQGRKRAVTNDEAMNILKKHSKNLRAAAKEIVEELLPDNFVPSDDDSQEALRLNDVLSSLRGELERFLAKCKK